MTMPCVIPAHDEPPYESALIMVDPDWGVDIEFYKVISYDWSDESARVYDLTTEDITRWNLWKYFNEDDFTDDGELILP